MQIIGLDEYLKINSALCGDKIKYLAKLKQKQLNVANGFAITDVLSIFSFNKTQIKEFGKCLKDLETVKKDNVEEMNVIAKKIKMIFENVQIKDKCKNNICRYYENIFLDKSMNGVGKQIIDLISTGRDKYIIVRPSVFYKNQEENANYCFSVFNAKKQVWKNQLSNAIKEVVLSYFSIYALFYYQSFSIIAKSINFSILIQQFMDIDYFGSICLKNPDTKNNEIIMENYISNQLNIKHIDVEKISELKNNINEKEKAIINLATKSCSALEDENIIIDWFASKEKIYIHNIRKIAFADNYIYDRQITATAKLSQDFEEGDILITPNFSKNAIFLFPKAQAVVFENAGQLSDAGVIAREMKVKFIDKFLISQNNINIDEINNKKITIQNQDLLIEKNNFFAEESLNQNFDNQNKAKDEASENNFFSKILIKINFNLSENDTQNLNQKANICNYNFLLEKFTPNEASQQNYYFDYNNYYSNTSKSKPDQNNLDIRELNINALFIEKDEEAIKINQLLGKNTIINHYYEFNNLKEIILFDFDNNTLPQNIFINTNAILGDLKNENLDIENIKKISKLIMGFASKNKQNNKKIIIGVVLTEEGKFILKQTFVYADFLLISWQDLEEFEKMHNLIHQYEQEFIFKYIKNKVVYPK